MSNNKERKEIASRLRVLASHKAADEELTLDALGLYRGENIEGFDTCCVMNLANLIEPEPERTCTFSEYKNDGDKYPTCSECEYETDWHECTWYSDDTFKYELNYCPNCGAKIIKIISNDTLESEKVINEFDCDYHCNECGQITKSKCPIFKKVIEQ